ncbi:MAG: HNH endonuclease signature motif containing protein, partial [Pseudonocardiaceae bacterium]
TTTCPHRKMRRYVKARDRYCVFPRCRRKTRRCPIDHTIKYFHDNGATCEYNLHPLCIRHHLMKDHPHSGWTLTNHSDNTWTRTTPNGQHHTGHPHDYRGP